MIIISYYRISEGLASSQIGNKNNGALYVEDIKATEKVYTENEHSMTVHEPKSLEQDHVLSHISEHSKNEIVVA